MRSVLAYPHAFVCSARTDFGDSGDVVLGQIESVIGVAIRHFDGHGQFEQVGNVKGSISGFSPDQPGFGTYQVNEDCSGVAQAQVSPTVLLEDRFVIVDDGNEIRSMVSVPAVMVTGVYKRTNTR